MKIIDPWFTVEKIDDSTFAISEYGHWEKVHSYLLVGTDNAILIDTGLGIDDIKRMTDQLTDLPIKVITTHVHWDHIGSHSRFSEIFVHEDEKDWLVNGIKGLSIEQIRKDVARDITIPVPSDFNPNTYTPFTGEPTGILKDETILTIGDRTLRIIHTPGHSPGHISIYEEERGYLYTGDLLYRGTMYAFYPTTDPIKFASSIEKLNNISYITKILGAHNELELDRSFLVSVCNAIQELSIKDLVKHGTGVHKFEGFNIHF